MAKSPGGMGGNHAWHLLFSPVFLAGASLLAELPVAAYAQEDPKDIVAVQVRSQGHECKSPQSAEMDQAASIPDEPVWILKCENATYRVRLKPDMAADIETMD